MAKRIGNCGPEHPRWRGGRYVTEKGYVRITAEPNRHKYEHVAITEELLGGPIPVGFDGQVEFRWEVHHMDGCRHHNCRSNLLLIDARLHRFPWWKMQRRTFDMAAFMRETAAEVA